MTDPTPESVEDALMNRLVALVDAWRANGTEPSAMALASIAGIVRENMPPACDCDGGLFGAGPGDHAIGCPARPVARGPVAGWVDRGEFHELVLIDAPCCRVLARAWNDGGWSVVAVTTAMAVTATIRNGRSDEVSLAAAKLAAEDAADALLCAGRRALGRVA